MFVFVEISIFLLDIMTCKCIRTETYADKIDTMQVCCHVQPCALTQR